jgi:hypothetical protein
MIEVYLLILAISNLITEQKIIREPIMRWFRCESYMSFNPIKKKIFDLISCPTCLSFWVGGIVALILGLSLLEAIKIGLIAMFIYAVIEKLRR